MATIGNGSWIEGSLHNARNFKIPRTDPHENIKLLKDTLCSLESREARVAVCVVFVFPGRSDARDMASEAS